MKEVRPRGRRPNALNPKIAESDRIIAMTVHRLSMWAFPVRDVWEEVGRQARDILGRCDSDKKPLGPDRIKQIFEKWLKTEKEVRRSGKQWPLGERWRYTKESLGERCPKKPLEIVAAELLRNGGNDPYPRPPLPYGDMVLSPKAAEQIGELSDAAMDRLVNRVIEMWHPQGVGVVGREFYEQLIRRCAGIAYRAGALGDAPKSLKRGN